MSDLCTYKIEGRVWDEYCDPDDHIVPQTGDKRSHRISFHGDGCEKPAHGVSHISSNFKERYSDEYVDLEREQKAYSRRRTMLENDSLFPTQQSLFPDSNSIRYAPGFISDNPKTSGHYFSNNNADSIGTTCSSNDAIHDEKSTAGHGHSYCHPLGETPQMDSDLNFFDNFEDVDMMFRSCDSTFGLGVSSDDEFGWFSLPDAQGGPRDSPKSDFKFPCPEPNTICSINNPASATPVKPKESSLHLCRDEFDSPLSIGPSSSDNTDEFALNDEIDEYKMHSKNQNPSERKRKEQYFGNGSSFSYFSNLTSEVIQCPYEDASSPAFQYVDIRHQQPDLGQDPYGLSRDALDCDNISPEAVGIRQLQHVTEQSFQGGTVIHSFILWPSSIAVK